MSKAILFDFDGVLVNTISTWFEINKELNPELSFEVYKEFSTGNFHDKVEQAAKDGTHVLDPHGDTKYRERLPNHSITPEIKLLIEKLAKDYMLFVVSSGSEKTIEEHLERENLLHHFQDVLGHESHKSKEEKIKNVLQFFTLPADNAVFVTDTSGDIVEAKNAGVRSIGVTWGLHEEGILKDVSPEKIVNTTLELEEAIEELLS